MNDEIIMNELEVNEEIEANEPKSGKGVGGMLIVGTLGLIAAGAAAWWVKTKDKREKRQIQKLKDKGYVVFGPDEFEAEDDGEE